MALFFTSDEHYGHKNIIEYCKRPFKDIDEMAVALVNAHNAKVNPGDTTWHLGDMFWRTLPLEKARSILCSLNGNHRLVFGNHDENIKKNEELQKRFIFIADVTTIEPMNLPTIVLCHYPFKTWFKAAHGSWHLYGHVHGVGSEDGLSMDVGVDANNYAPVSLEEVMVKMYKKAGDKAFRQVKHDKAARIFLDKYESSK